MTSPSHVNDVDLPNEGGEDMEMEDVGGRKVSVLDNKPEVKDEFKDLKKRLKLDRERALKKRSLLEIENKEEKRRKTAEYQRRRYWMLKNMKVEKPDTASESTSTKEKLVTVNKPNPKLPVQCRVMRKAVIALENDEKHRKTNEVTISKNDVPMPTTSFTDKKKDENNQATKGTTSNPKSTTKCPTKKKSSKVSDQERRKKVRERVQKFRSKLTPEQLEKKREYDRNYKLKRKAEGTWKTRADLSDREKRRQRKLSRESTRRFREKQKLMKNKENHEPAIETPKSNKALSGKKKKNLNRSKVYRRLNDTLKKLRKSEKRAERYKKRLYRLKEKSKGSPSPGKKIRVLAGGRKVPTPVKRRLTYLECINTELEKKKKELLKGSKKDLSAFNKIVCSPAIKEKKLIRAAKQLVGTNKTYKRGSCIIQRKTESVRKLKKQTIDLVKQFYFLDINSKQLPGKKDYITRHKVQKQKRLLLHSLKDLWGMYNKRHPNNCVSYPTFRRLRPFWVVYPTLSDLDTCACQICDNMKLIHNKARNEQIIDVSLVNLIELSVCNKKRKMCMFNKCKRCINTTPLMVAANNEEDQVIFKQWKSGKKTLDNGKVIKVMTKETIECTKKELLEKLLRQLIAYKCHIFKIEHQFSEISMLKETLKSNECLLHIDFSENYLCKMHTEIQSCHFGGTKKQLSLHTVVMYTNDAVQSICTVSENTDHKAEAVRAHLKPVLQSLPNNIDTIHIKSDGPSSQYKNRYNFYYIQNIQEICSQVKSVTWNFSVAGHGKGPSDGVGGTVKRVADSRVLFGNDVTDVKSFMENVENNLKSVKLIEVPSYDINEMKKRRPDKVAEIKGISKVLQVTYSSGSSKLHLRELSCFSCEFNESCDHHHLGTVSLDTSENSITSVLEDENVINNENLISAVQYDPEEVDEGSWVAVVYDNTWYPGIVERCNEDFLSVSFMARSGGKFFWPSVPDVQTVERNNILCRVDTPPHPVSSRHFDMSKDVIHSIEKLFKTI